MSFLSKTANTANIVCFWTGETPMSPGRRRALNALEDDAGVLVRCLDPIAIETLELPKAPFHPALRYLSETHRADYLRVYVMHFYGGGYSDIKAPTDCWNKAFEAFASDSTAYISGYPESGPDCTANPELKAHWKHLLGNGAYIVRPQTPFTTAWFAKTTAVLDTKLSALKAHPATHARDCAEEGNGYPLRWSEMLGQIFHPLCYQFREHLRFDVPIPDCQIYK